MTRFLLIILSFLFSEAIQFVAAHSAVNTERRSTRQDLTDVEYGLAKDKEKGRFRFKFQELIKHEIAPPGKMRASERVNPRSVGWKEKSEGADDD